WFIGIFFSSYRGASGENGAARFKGHSFRFVVSGFRFQVSGFSVDLLGQYKFSLWHMVASVRALNRVYQLVYKLSTYFYTER
ncbi:hypothetical protein AEV65_23760, partial [Salmonella enterica subsp. enterica serovar Typhimurium var. 5-]|uniref:hypothetical protein n=2 Tax=Salmonella enterica TaxID=28901 RepID=UPI0006A52B74